MKTYRAIIRMTGGFISKLQSDTIFGGLCWAYKSLAGDRRLEVLLASCREGFPPFVVSDLFPGDLLPKPLLQPPKVTEQMKKNELLEAAREAKRLKSEAWLRQDEFLSLAAGRWLVPEPKKKQFTTVMTMHNTVDRLAGTTTDEGGLYDLPETFVNTNNQGEPNYLSLYLKVREGWEDIVPECLRLLGRFGLGKRRSVGKGGFTVGEYAPFTSFDQIKDANAFISLSHFTPAAGDPVVGSYKTMVKFGRLDREYAYLSNPFKYPVIMLIPGSVFYTGGQPREYYGIAVEKVAQGQPAAIQGCFAFAAPARVEVDHDG